MTPYYQHDGITLYCGDNREIVPILPDNGFDFICTDPPYGLDFMGAEWDHGVPGVRFWQNFLYVCKPGAMMLAFGGTRTYHRLVCAIEDAGWEIRDGLLELLASDARFNDLWESLTGEQRKLFAEWVDPGQILMWLQGQGFPKAPDVGLLIDKAHGIEREVIGDKLDRPGYHLHEGKGGGCYGGGKGLHAPGTDARVKAAQITAPATEAAKLWTGWANALKPAWEPIALAMKPLDGTLAHNAETWGVAGLNIDASRIPTPDPNVPDRWPANLLLDETAAGLLDKQTGILKSGMMKAGQQRKRSRGLGGYHDAFPDNASQHGTYGDSGGASRFFYVAKATTKERNPPGLKNDHPTVKPLKLMEQLLTLLSTPTGGMILDPFAGSGSTLLAAKQLGRPCVGIELSEHNCQIAVARLNSL